MKVHKFTGKTPTQVVCDQTLLWNEWGTDDWKRVSCEECLKKQVKK